MTALLEGLPADVVGAKVLSLLDVQDLVKLDSAFLHKEGRKVLLGCFRFVTVRPNMRSLRRYNIAALLQWLSSRGIRLTYLYVERSFLEVLPLLASNPRLVEKLHMTCTDQVAIAELEQVLVQLQDDAMLRFQLDFYPQTPASLHDAKRLRRHVSGGITWNTNNISTEDASALVQDNHNLHSLCIFYPTAAAIEITASLGATLTELALCGVAERDDQLAVIGYNYGKLKSIYLSHENGHLSEGVIALARGCKELQTVDIECDTADSAVSALCSLCPRTYHTGLPHHSSSRRLACIRRAVAATGDWLESGLIDRLRHEAEFLQHTDDSERCPGQCSLRTNSGVSARAYALPSEHKFRAD
jgi:hypothetical protein